MSHREKNVMMWRFQTVGSKMVLLKNFVFRYMRPWKFWEKKLLFCAHRGALGLYWYCFPLNCKEFSSRINLHVNISRTETRNGRFFHLCLFNKIYKIGSIIKVWLLWFWYCLKQFPCINKRGNSFCWTIWWVINLKRLLPNG